MRIKDYTDMVGHLTDSFNIPEARRMIAENPALSREQFAEGQLVQPGPGRQGYQGEDPHGNWTPENLKKYKSYIKDKDFIKLQKDNPKLPNRWLVDRYSRILLKKNKIVGLQGLVDALGPDNPYTKDTLNNTYGYAKQKITKNMPNVEKAKIKASQRIWNIINETLGEPKTDWAIRKSQKRGVTGTRPTKMWDLNESKLKKLSKALNKNWRVQGYYPATLETVYKLAENEELMKALDGYKGGKIGNDHPILKALLTGEKTGAKAHAYTILGEAWRGDIALEGITKNLKRGNSVIKSLHGNFEGPLGSAFLQWAKRRMAKDFDNPKATYTSLVRTMRDALNSADLNHLAVDEIFPVRTGQLTIGKGSGAYNHIIQFIDGEINSIEKKSFDAVASKRYQAIIEAMKGKNPNWARVNQLVEKHKTAINDFFCLELIFPSIN